MLFIMANINIYFTPKLRWNFDPFIEILNAIQLYISVRQMKLNPIKSYNASPRFSIMFVTRTNPRQISLCISSESKIRKP